MAKKTVLFSQTIGISVTVETDSTDPEEILEKAWEEAPGSICGQCSGWGQSWSRDDDGELIPEENEDGTPVIYDEEN